MKTDIETLQDTFKISYDAFEESRNEALLVLDFYHNRHYTADQLATLKERGQPAETFNVIKMFANLLIGYYSTVTNQPRVKPTKESSVITAQVLQDTVDYVLRVNNFATVGDSIKLDGILTGLMVSYVDVVENGDFDQFGRPKYDINMSHVPSLEVLTDPLSKLPDNSDARFTHRFKWISGEEAVKLYGQDKVDKLDSYDNHLSINEADFTFTYTTEFHGKYKTFDNYLVVHTIIEDENGDTWSKHWSGDIILSEKKVTYKDVKNPYRIEKINTSNKTEFYGMFREVVETQNAINQALLKLQLMVNTQKAYVETGAVENIDDFTTQFNRVNAVIPVKKLVGLKIETLSKEVLDQYTIIDKALDRIQRVLSINDSFLGMAYASDSGSKVQLQKNASVVAQRFMTTKIEEYYRLLGWDVINLIKQYFTATDVIRVSDDYQGNKWVELNTPLQIPTGRQTQNGQMETRMVFEEVLSPETNEPMEAKDGSLLMAPIPTGDTDITFTTASIEIETVASNDDDQENQVMLDQIINSPAGQMLSQVNPQGYFKVVSMSVKNIKSKYSPEISAVFESTAEMLGGGQQQLMQQGQLEGQQPMGQAVNQIGGK